MNNPNNLPAKPSDILIYQAEDGRSRVLVRLENETAWLTQAMLAELYQTSPQNITLHIKSIYEEGELIEEATCKEYLQVRTEGSRKVQRHLKRYNLDMVLAVGYRVRSQRGTQFRQWATERLREYIVKGFTLDDERLKGVDQRVDYFDELLARIRMHDWELFLDKFLSDTELPVLPDAGPVSRAEALSWASTQYDLFSERRRLEAESAADARYLDDLRQSAKALENNKTISGKSGKSK